MKKVKYAIITLIFVLIGVFALKPLETEAKGVGNGSTIIRVKFNNKEITIPVKVEGYLKGDLNYSNAIELEDVMEA